MLIFLDFDDVLFNTKKFKDAYFDLFKKRGVSREIFERFYYDPLDKRKTKNYSPIEHIERISREINLDYSEFEKSILEFTADTSKYVFPDAEKLLDRLPKKYLYLISFSKTNFQKSKIFNSGLSSYFNQIEITNKLKGEIIKKIIKKRSKKDDELIYFVDDRVEHLTDAKIKNPEISTILFSRKEGRHRDKKNKYCDYVVTSVEEILKIINLKQKNVKKAK